MPLQEDLITVLTDVWRDPGAHLKLFTRRTAEDIPQTPGVYAWFYPLDVRADTIEEVQRAAEESVSVACFYSEDENNEAEGQLRLGWEDLAIRARRETKFDFDKHRNAWQQLLGNLEAYAELSQAIYVATLFSRPLYVGLTNRGLRQRYMEHVTGRNSQFHHRFMSHMRNLKLEHTVEDLLYACVPVRASRVSNRQVELIESLLKHICQPPFGER